MPAFRILLINPNSLTTTTDMMVAIARDTAGDRAIITGATATRAPPMIVDAVALDASEAEVVEIGLAAQAAHDGIIVAAFGDPGLSELQAAARVPCVGIGESAFLAAAEGGRRFAIVSVTAGLAARAAERIAAMGLAACFAGTRAAAGASYALTRDPDRLRDALADAVRLCFDEDGAEAVIIGGGPLAAAAAELERMFARPVISPVRAAVERVGRKAFFF